MSGEDRAAVEFDWFQDPLQVQAAIAEAEDRGYRRAVQALRDEAAWADYMLSLDDADLYGGDNLIAANFLEIHAAAPRNEAIAP